ncbi:MAG: RagB/SusD family nutrient uptake outer membrane protein [Chitinophagaceae bacterium]|nr:RagB/SusD family nutrient uptake outer membrane protein [Chitinophagaceae bacterium]
MKKLISNNFREKTGRYFLAAVCIMFLAGCKLEPTIYSNSATDKYYSNESEANLGLNGVYQMYWNIYKPGYWHTMSDYTAGVSINMGATATAYSAWDFTVDGQDELLMWSSIFNAINRANTLLDGLEKSTLITDAAKARFNGQARFLRALGYFELVKLWGGVPLHIKGTASLADVNLPRSSEAEVYKQIETDLTTAATELSPFNETDQSNGRVTSLACLAVLADIYAQQGKWAEAAATAKQVIDAGYFQLLPDFHDIYRPGPSLNKEEIFSIVKAHQAGDVDATNKEVRWFVPSRSTLSDGTAIAFFAPPFNGPNSQVVPDFFNSTPDTYRKYWTMRKEMPYYYVLGDYNNVHMTPVPLPNPLYVKFMYVNLTDGLLDRGVNMVIYRLAYMKLLYAEALNEANSGPTAEAYDAVNEIRRRARAVGTANEQPAGILPDLAGLSQGAFRDSVLIEFKREFANENKYRSVLLRHNLLVSDAIERGVTAAKEYKKYFAIPSDELARNPNLTQNEGY